MQNQGLKKIDLQPTTLRDVVLARLRDAIIDGTFKPGERLVERVLCEQLGVSRTVVRETLRYLDAEGLVEHQANVGPRVSHLTWDDARQIYDIRLKLETAAAADCAINMTADQQRQLATALRDLQSAAKDQTPGALFKATTKFYSIIFAGAGHTIAWEVVQRLNGRISRLRIMTLASSDREALGPVHMHKICDAIISRDPVAARAAVERHLTDAKAVAAKMLAEEKVTP